MLLKQGGKSSARQRARIFLRKTRRIIMLKKFKNYFTKNIDSIAASVAMMNGTDIYPFLQ